MSYGGYLPALTTASGWDRSYRSPALAQPAPRAIESLDATPWLFGLGGLGQENVALEQEDVQRGRLQDVVNDILTHGLPTTDRPPPRSPPPAAAPVGLLVWSAIGLGTAYVIANWDRWR